MIEGDVFEVVAGIILPAGEVGVLIAVLGVVVAVVEVGVLVTVGVVVTVVEVGVLVTVEVVVAVLDVLMIVGVVIDSVVAVSGWLMAGRIKIPSFRRQNTEHIMQLLIFNIN